MQKKIFEAGVSGFCLCFVLCFGFCMMFWVVFGVFSRHFQCCLEWLLMLFKGAFLCACLSAFFSLGSAEFLYVRKMLFVLIECDGSYE